MGSVLTDSHEDAVGAPSQGEGMAGLAQRERSRVEEGVEVRLPHTVWGLGDGVPRRMAGHHCWNGRRVDGIMGFLS